MTSIERFVLAHGHQKQAWGPSWGQVGSGALGAADIATDFMPVVGGVKNLGKAVYHGAQGQWGSMLGDVGMAGLGMLGLGGVGRAAKGIGWAAKMAPKFKGIAEAAPTLTKGITSLGSGIGSAGRALWSPSTALSKKFVSTGLGRAVASTKGQITAGAGGFGLQHLGGKLNEASAVARQGNEENLTNMRNSLQQMHQNPVFNNPMYTGGGMNPNYADVNPVGYGQPGGGPSMASQFLGPALNYFLGS